MNQNIVRLSIEDACVFASKVAGHPWIEFPEIPAIYREETQTYVLGYKDEQQCIIKAIIWGLILPGKVKVSGISPDVSLDIQEQLFREVLYNARQMGVECSWEVNGIREPDVSEFDASFPKKNRGILNKLLRWQI